MTLQVLDKPMREDVRMWRGRNETAHTNVPWTVIDHSPTGFEWGYGGSGPADFSLNILNAFMPPGWDNKPSVECFQGEASETAYILHQHFKWDVIARCPKPGGKIYAESILKYLGIDEFSQFIQSVKEKT